jgi:hypothetical protein
MLINRHFTLAVPWREEIGSRHWATIDWQRNQSNACYLSAIS